jgi:uncharacterized protein (TIGR03118 family)
MMMSSNTRIVAASLGLAVLAAAICAFAAGAAAPIANPIPQPITPGNAHVDLELVAEGLTAPLGMAVPDDGSGRMFIYDQAGQAWVVVNGNQRSATPLLDVSSRLVPLDPNYDERGLLGLATHPDFANFPLVYTYTSEPNTKRADFVADMPAGTEIDHQSVIAEWRIDPNDPNRVDPNSRRELLRIDKPQANNNGGTIRFGPDGYLYISLGDGGDANDVGPGHAPGGNAQNLNRIWGKILRLDVDGNNSTNGNYGIPTDNPFATQNAVHIVWAYGLRNPYSFSFDSLTGDLYAGDAGENTVEEVDHIVKGGNYGWNIKEGSFWFDPNTGQVVTTEPNRPIPANLIDPIAEYDHDEGSVVIGGYVYRGSRIPSLQGLYVFGDFGGGQEPTARLFYFDPNSAEPNAVIQELGLSRADRPCGFWLRGFGEDACGELYVFTSTMFGPTGNTGKVYRIVRCLPMTYQEQDLVSDLPGRAPRQDPNLINPWGIVAGPNTPLWISDNGAGLSSIYDANGAQVRPPVTIPAPGGGTSAPTGIVFNSTTDFPVEPNEPARFIFATEDGTIAAWYDGNTAVLKADQSASGAIYKGLALASAGGLNRLYATDFHNGKVDVFDANFALVTLSGAFADPNLPAGYAPFGIANLDGQLYVTYALQDANAVDDVPGPGNGYVDVFDPNGVLVKRFATQCQLDSPWAVVRAPVDFGGFGGMVLIGNFGDGRINAYHPVTGVCMDSLLDAQANPIVIEGLWGLMFGTGGRGGDPNTLYFAAGIPDGGAVEDHGLFGTLTPVAPQ